MSASHSFIQLVPIGEHPHIGESGKKIVQVVDADSVRMMANNFRPKVLVDQDHFSRDLSKSSEAFGWIVEVQPRSDGLDGRIEWTDSGERAVINSRYRFASPVFLQCDLQSLGGNRYRPTRLDSVGLTNTPNIKTIRPLLNRSHSTSARPSNHRPAFVANRTAPDVLANLSIITMQDLVEGVKRAGGGSFEEAWIDSRAILNRFGDQGTADAAAIWSDALEKEQEAFDATFDMFSTSLAESGDRGRQLYRGITQPRINFLDAIRKLMAERGLPFEKSWEQLRESGPLYFLRHIWAMTEPAGGRG